MTYNDIDPSVRLFLGARELLRRLGFKAEEVFFVTARSIEDKKLHVFCELLAQGKAFSVDCGPAEKDEADMAAAYEQIAAAVNDGTLPGDDLECIWSGVKPSAAAFASGLVSKGFKLPCNNWSLS